MDWGEWFCLLHDQEQKLSAEFCPWIDLTIPGDLAKQFQQIDEETEKEVEEAIFHFAAESRWPQLSRRAGAMLLLRVIQAEGLARELSFLRASLQSVPATPPFSHEQCLVWFLIETWEHVSFGRIAENLEDLRRANWREQNPDTPGLGYGKN